MTLLTRSVRIFTATVRKPPQRTNLSVRACFSQIAPGTQSETVSQSLVYQQLPDSDAGIGVLALNRPKAKNAFCSALVTDIIRTLDEVAVDRAVRVLVLRSLVPGTFGAGADLKERATMQPQQVALFVTSLRAMLNKLYELPVPVIAAVDGIALGGGLEMALACDIRVASTSAKMGLVETRLAIIPGAGGSQRLPRLISPSLAKELIYTARIFDGSEAKTMGIVNHAVKQNDAGDAAYQKSLEIAREMLPNGPFAIKMAKAAINMGAETDLRTAFEIEKACYAQIIPTKDRTEGLLAFKEKRRPVYTGE